MNRKRILSAFLAGATALTCAVSFASCGKSKEPPKQKRTHVYTAEEIPLPGVSYVNQMMSVGNDVYFTYSKEYTVTYNELGEEVERIDGYNYSEIEKKEASLPEGWWFGYDSSQNLARISVDTGALSEVPLNVEKEDGSSYMSGLGVSSDGRILAVTQEWTYNEDYTESSVLYTLYDVNPDDGSILNEVSLNDGIVKAGLDPANTYLNTMKIGPDGTLCFTIDAGVLMFGPDGSYRSKVDGIDGWVSNMICLDDKMLLSWYPNNGGGQQYKYLVNGQLTDIQSDVLKEAMQGYYSFVGASGSVLYLSGNGGIFTYDTAADVFEEKLNFINSDIDDSNNSGTAILSDGRIIMVSTEWNDESTKSTLNVMKPVPDEELAEEIIVTIGCIYSDYYLKKSIIRYNKQNTGIRIAVKDYSSYNNEDNEWTGAQTQLNNDIITGSLPDLILLDRSLPIDSYFHKGIFTDLTPYIDGENGINRSQYLSNLFDLCSVDGKQYSMLLSYSLGSVFAKKEFVGDQPGWTFEEMMACIDSMPEGMEAFWGESRDSIIDMFFQYAMDSFVDWDTGETKFETEGFTNFLRFLSTCPEKSAWDQIYGEGVEYDEEAYREFDQQYAMRYYQNRSLFSFTYISMVTDLLYARNNFASKEITAIGYPTDVPEANGAAIIPGLELAISQKSPARDQAWEILRFFLTDEEFEKSLYQFPPRIAALEKKAEEAGENYYYYEGADDEYDWYLEMGYTQEYVDYLKNSRQPYDPSVKDETLNLIRGAKSIVRSDSALLDIIKEELSGFFAGTKSAEETARVIASRARIYISENS